MSSYFFALAWGILTLLSLIGWGSGLNWLLFPKEKTDWGQRAAWGLALSVVVGGVLNLLSCISRAVILVYLGLGILLWIIGLLVQQPWRTKSASPRPAENSSPKPLLIGGMLLVAFLTLIQYAGSISVARYDYPSSPSGAVRFNQADDFQAYFVFPEKMLQLGSMGRDPFCARKLESSLGGQSFLHTFLLSVLSVQNLHILDPGLGLLLIIGLLWGNFKERGTSLAWSLALLLVLVWIDPPTVNVASLYTGTALFLSLCRTLAWKTLSTSRFLSRTLIIALIASATCSLKSSFIPACGMLLACSFLCYVIGQNFRRDAIAELITTAVLVVAFTLPWMISMYQSSGTLLYPLLGKGYHQSAYNDSLCAYCWLTLSTGVGLLSKHLTDVPSVAVGALGILYLASRRRAIHGREAVLSLLVGAAFGHVVITLATAESFSRYSFPFLLAAILILITEAASPTERPGQKRLAASRPLVAGAVALFLVGATWDPSRTLYLECLRSAQDGLRHKSLVSNQEVEAYRILQQSIPPGEALLEKLEKPFLLDFKRNTIFLVDWAEASPPPGMPFSKGSEALARYLASLHIRYVAYSYAGEAERRKLPTYFPWMKNQLLYTYDFEDNLEGLGKTRRRIYDDGHSFVLDLVQPPSGPAAQ
jgi:hypothetical protein